MCPYAFGERRSGGLKTVLEEDRQTLNLMTLEDEIHENMPNAS
jgi:hypothetical protein